jgi:BirA family biotin operon repressor/biotin-[acetyl-CoA-carboxylase] ligase
LAWFLAEALAAGGGWDLLLKWPNDLLLDGGKTAGVLLEARRGLVVAGVGLNLGLAPGVERGPDQPPAAALPGAPPPLELWSELVKSINLRYNGKIMPWTMAETVAAAEKRLWRRNGLIRVLAPASEPPADSAELAGRLTGLGPCGELLLNDGRRLWRIWSGTLLPGGPDT